MASRAEWTKRVKQWQASGLSAGEFAEQEGIKERSLIWWKWKLRSVARSPPASAASTFLPVRVLNADAMSPAATSPIEIVLPNGRILRVPPSFDETALERILAIVAGGDP